MSTPKDIIRAILNADGDRLNDLVENGELSLENANIRNAQVGSIVIHDVDCTNTEWDACIFDGTTFDNINMEGAFLNGCTFNGCTFLNCRLASFDGCVFQGTHIIGGVCENAEITNSQLKNCIIEHIEFSDTSIESITVSSGKVNDLAGSAELVSVVFRNVEVERFDTSDMTTANCTASGCPSVPAGFTASEGRRRRV